MAIRHAMGVFSLLVLAVGVEAMTPQPAVAATAATAGDLRHEVAPGDSLRLIAGYYYGDTRQWTRIWTVNRNQLRNPNRLERGSVLVIPNAVAPAEPYAEFVARTRGAAPAWRVGDPAAATSPAPPGPSNTR
jgi:LysM domain